MNIRRLTLAVVAVLLLAPAVWGQADRYELGRRLRSLEFAWDAQPDPIARRRAVPALNQAVQAFFAQRPSDVGRALDQARFQLRSVYSPAAAEQWATAIQLRLVQRLIDRKNALMTYTLSSLYRVDVPPPKNVLAHLQVLDTACITAVPIAELPFQGELALPEVKEGDYRVRCEMLQAEKILAHCEQTISVVDRLQERLSALRNAVAKLPKTPVTTDKESLRALTRLIAMLADEQTLETDFPAARLMSEAEGIVRSIQAGKPYFGAEHPGQFWLTLATTQGIAPVRVSVPKAASKGDLLPLVVALHGAGGSENLFFDAYGHGLIETLCQQRGWLLVAPRSPGLGGAPVAAIVDSLASIYPVDKKRVLLVGHSMGATQVVSAAQRDPKRYVAVAALGGGGVVQSPDNLAPHYFVGVGSADFALRAARVLRDNLRKSAKTDVHYREYPDIEHMVIVQAALPDVFSFFDQALKSQE